MKLANQISDGSADADYDSNYVCECNDGFEYPITSGNCYATAKPTTTATLTESPCEFDGPQSNCPAETQILNIPGAVESGQAAFNASMLSNCSDTQYYSGNPGPDALAEGYTCADAIPIAPYITWWWAENNAKCTANGVGFANCFYDDVVHGPSSNCSNLGGNFYCPQPNASDFSGVNATVEYYVAYNIYNFATWAYWYYTALFQGGFLAGTQVWNASDSFVVPPKAIPTWAFYLMAALTMAFSAISPSGWAKEVPFESGSTNPSVWWKKNQVPGEYVLREVQQAPGLAGNILPTGADGDADAAISAGIIEAKIGEYMGYIADTMLTAAVSVPNNITAFIEWTSNGFFYTEPPDIDTTMDQIKVAINTFIMSQILQNDNFVIARQLDTNPLALYTNGTQGIDLRLINCPGYDSWSMCNVWWYWSDGNAAYSLFSTDANDWHHNYTDDLEAFFDNGNLTPEDLFLGSQLCAIGANTPQGGAPGLTFNYTEGSIATACLSNIQICTWNLEDSWPQFYESECPSQPGYDDDDCPADAPDPPYGDLGWDLFNGAACEEG